MFSVAQGTCHVIFVYDIAFSIDLKEAEKRLSSATRETIHRSRRAPSYFEYRPAPLRISQTSAPVRIDKVSATSSGVELVIYDFGTVSVIYRIPLGGAASDLLSLSEGLYDNAQLLADSRHRVQELIKFMEPAISKPGISPFVEDYVIFQVGELAGVQTIDELTSRHAQDIAQILRAERRELSADEVNDAMSHRISYGKDDVAIVDWNAALLVDKEADDLLTVLEFANVELLELRFLDQRLADALSQAYDRLSKHSRKWVKFRSNPSDLSDISEWQVDNAILFEGVNNVLKLLGDQYLARLYRLAAQRFHLTEWDSGIQRKLETLEGIYQKLSDRVVGRRMEVLEWIVIILIAIEILLPFLPGLAR